MAKYQIVVKDLTSNNVFVSKSEEHTAEELEDIKNFLKSMAEDGAYLSFIDKDDTWMVIPKKILRRSVIYLQKA